MNDREQMLSELEDKLDEAAGTAIWLVQFVRWNTDTTGYGWDDRKRAGDLASTVRGLLSDVMARRGLFGLDSKKHDTEADNSDIPDKSDRPYIPPTQADREAAFGWEDWAIMFDPEQRERQRELYLSGKRDRAFIVQSYARHRETLYRGPAASDARIKHFMEQVGMPNSMSLYQALQKFEQCVILGWHPGDAA